MEITEEKSNDVSIIALNGRLNVTTTADLEKACRKAFGKAPLVTFNLGGVVSANTGPDTLALVYVGKPRD